MTMDYDELLDKAGGFGPWQLLLWAAMSGSSCSYVWISLGVIFTTDVPEHWCQVDDPVLANYTNGDWELYRKLAIPPNTHEGVDSHYSRCENYVRNYSSLPSYANWSDWLAAERNTTAVRECAAWHYDAGRPRTMSTDWNLVCEREWLVAFATSLYYIGQIVGCLSMGMLADRFGRRRILCIGMICRQSLNLLQTFMPSVVPFLVVRFVIGIFMNAINVCGFVLAIEMLGKSRRELLSLFDTWSIFYIAYAGLAYLIQDWFKLQLTASCLGMVALAVCFLPESPRWLYLRGRRDEADRTMRLIARVNRRKVPDHIDVTVPHEVQRSGTVVDLFRTPTVRRRSLLIMYMWFTTSCTYYGLTYSMGKLTDDLYSGFAISGSFELLAQLCACAVLKLLGRRYPLTTALAAGSILLFCSMISMPRMASFVMAMTGKFFMNVAFIILYVYSGELFPTNMRTTGVTTASTCARLGAVIAPQISLNARRYVSVYFPPIFFGVISAVAASLVLFLPETKNRRMEETAESLEEHAAHDDDGDEEMKLKEFDDGDGHGPPDGVTAKDVSLIGNGAPHSSSSSPPPPHERNGSDVLLNGGGDHVRPEHNGRPLV